MKLINPFDRLKKRNSVPLSLFPASKKTATTMPVGRAVPLYCIDMIQGNRLRLSVDQLTRFMEMNGPLMQNFEITYGAYFVPYVALDHFFNSAWFSTNVKNASNFALHARDFFNPATPDSLRVKCLGVTPLGMPVGYNSLFSHLGYPVLDLKTSGYVKATALTSNTPVEFSSFYQLCNSSFYDASSIAVADAMPDSGTSAPVAVTVSQNFLMFCYLHSDIAKESSLRDVPDDFKTSFAYHAFRSTEPTAVPYTWRDMFGNRTLQSLQYEYIVYINKHVKQYLERNIAKFEDTSYLKTKTNLYRWLAYLRIYSDWYLNPIYTAEEDFRDMVGCAYIDACNSSDSPLEHFTAPNNKKLVADSTLSFFADYIGRGECLPVLWKKDQLTSLVKTDASSDVAIGSTIGENFYNRMYAKFKDLVARMGRDYRQNTKALYGSPVGDNSLQRSQVIGYKSFTVQVGEIAQTSPSTIDSNQGSFVGYAVSRDKAGLFDWTAEENGMVMIIAYIRPTSVAISTQVDKSLYKFDYLDYLIPEFGGVGYQTVKANRFDYTQPNDRTLGLEERYAEYMSVPSEVSGDFRSVYQYMTADRLQPQLYIQDTADFYKNIYMTEQDMVSRVFQNSAYDPCAVVAFFNGTITRQLPATIRTDF